MIWAARERELALISRNFYYSLLLIFRYLAPSPVNAWDRAIRWEMLLNVECSIFNDTFRNFACRTSHRTPARASHRRFSFISLDDLSRARQRHPSKQLWQSISSLISTTGGREEQNEKRFSHLQLIGFKFKCHWDEWRFCVQCCANAKLFSRFMVWRRILNWSSTQFCTFRNSQQSISESSPKLCSRLCHQVDSVKMREGFFPRSSQSSQGKSRSAQINIPFQNIARELLTNSWLFGNNSSEN